MSWNAQVGIFYSGRSTGEVLYKIHLWREFWLMIVTETWPQEKVSFVQFFFLLMNLVLTQIFRGKVEVGLEFKAWQWLRITEFIRHWEIKFKSLRNFYN